MANIGIGKLQSPMFTRPLTCICWQIGKKCLTTSNALKSTSPNEGYTVNPEFHNRNPRNLEKMGLAWKPKGWVLQDNKKTGYYNMLEIIVKDSQMIVRIVHNSGQELIRMTNHNLYITAGIGRPFSFDTAAILGKMMGHRLQEIGLTHVFLAKTAVNSKKREVLLREIQKAGIVFEEIPEKTFEYKPGVDHSKPNRIGEKAVPDDVQLM